MGRLAAALLLAVVPTGFGLAAPLQAVPLAQIELGGDPGENVGSDLIPLDVDGDGKFELFQFNGFRLMRMFRFNGDLGTWTKLWEIRNPAGRTNRDLFHRDRWAFVDIDGDGRDEIIGCWALPGRKSRVLTIRNGATGAVIRMRDLQDPNTSECRLTAQRMVGGPGVVIIVAKKALTTDSCFKGYLDTLSRLTAYDIRLNTMWNKRTCDAGHHFRPVDENGDGVAEAVGVGKYLVARNGATKCTYPEWGTDHIDSATVADIDPGQPGLEIVTTGLTGTRLFRAATCELLWSIPVSVIPNPQSAFAARIDPADPDTLSVVVRPKESNTALRIDALSGQVVGAFAVNNDMKSVAQLDGEGIEEAIAQWGDVYDATGELRLGRQWFWDLQTLTLEEQALPDQAKWSIRAVAADLDGNGRDELIVWGRKLFVVGQVSAAP